MPHIDLTSVWIPGGLIGILVLIMIRLFIKERRSAAALKAERVDQAAPAAAPAEAQAAAAPPPMAEKPAEAAAAEAPAVTEASEAPAAPTEPPKAEAPAAVTTAPAEKVKAKRSLVWRTAWIWLPFLVGFFGQGYLEHRAAIDPLIKKITG